MKTHKIRIITFLLFFTFCTPQLPTLRAMEQGIGGKQEKNESDAKKQKLETNDNTITNVHREISSLQDIVLKKIANADKKTLKMIVKPQNALLQSYTNNPKFQLIEMLIASKQFPIKHFLQLPLENQQTVTKVLQLLGKENPLDTATVVLAEQVLHTLPIVQNIRDQLTGYVAVEKFKEQTAKKLNSLSKEEEKIDLTSHTATISQAKKHLTALTSLINNLQDCTAFVTSLNDFHNHFADSEHENHKKMLLAVAKPLVREQKLDLSTIAEEETRFLTQEAYENREEARGLFERLPEESQYIAFQLAVRQCITEKEKSALTHANMPYYQALYDEISKIGSQEHRQIVGAELTKLYEKNRIVHTIFNDHTAEFDPDGDMSDAISELWPMWQLAG